MGTEYPNYSTKRSLSIVQIFTICPIIIVILSFIVCIGIMLEKAKSQKVEVIDGHGRGTAEMTWFVQADECHDLLIHKDVDAVIGTLCYHPDPGGGSVIMDPDTNKVTFLYESQSVIVDGREIEIVSANLKEVELMYRQRI